MKKFKFFKLYRIKNFVMSLVALVLIAVMIVGISYSWIENFTAIQIITSNSDDTHDTALHTATKLDSTVVIGNHNNEFNAVDLGSYLYESGDMHLATCSGNGDTFYFRKVVGTGTVPNYRLGTKDDINTNYISCTFKVSSPEANTDFWFNAAPTITGSGSSLYNSHARYAITVDGKTNVYSSSGGNYRYVNSTSGSTATYVARTLSNYVYNDNRENNYENVLFSVDRGEIKTVTVKIWFEDTSNNSNNSFSGKDVDINMVLASSWAKTRTITLNDYTNDKSGYYWLGNDDGNGHNPAMFLALKDNTDIHYQLSKNNHIYTAKIPAVYKDSDIYFLRFQESWDNGNNPLGDTGLNGWNYWETTLPVKGNAQYNVIGNGGDDNGHKGHGTWNNVLQIYVTDYASPSEINPDNKISVIDNDREDDTYDMRYDGNVNGRNQWSTYIDENSTKITFNYNDSAYSWGFNGSAETKDQKRPTTNTSTDNTRTDHYSITEANSNGENLNCNGNWGKAKTVASTYYLMGFGDWDTGAQMYYQDAMLADGGNIVYTSKNLEAGTYTFNIKNKENNTSYGNKNQVDIVDKCTDLDIGDSIYENDCKFTATGGNYLFIYNISKNTLTVKYVPSLPASGEARCYVLIPQGWGDGWLKQINHWTANNPKRDIHKIGNYRYNNTDCYLYYVDLETTATHMQWVNGSTYCPQNGGTFTTTIQNGAMYYMLTDNVSDCGKNTVNIQNAPTRVIANGYTGSYEATLGEPIKLSASVNSDGTAYKGNNVSFYVQDADAGVSRNDAYLVDSTWLPHAPGTYYVYAKADDGYITTDLCNDNNRIKITVTDIN